MFVWLNGEFVPVDEAKVSAFDAGLQHGVGLFETMAARNGVVFRAREHLQRLAESARTLRLTEQLRIDPLLDAIELTLRKNNLADARIRLTLTGGDLNLLARGESDQPRTAHDPTILIHAQPPQRYPDGFFEDGITVAIADGRLNPLDRFAGHKALNYWPRLSALQQAASVGAGEAVWFTVSNHLAGGSVSNVFLVKNDELRTPIARGEETGPDPEVTTSHHPPTPGVAMPSPVLPGITRRFIMEAADGLGITPAARMLDINDLLGADEVFLTNSSWGVLPVVAVERESIGNGKVGPWTMKFRDAWLGAGRDQQAREG